MKLWPWCLHPTWTLVWDLAAFLLSSLSGKAAHSSPNTQTLVIHVGDLDKVSGFESARVWQLQLTVQWTSGWKSSVSPFFNKSAPQINLGTKNIWILLSQWDYHPWAPYKQNFLSAPCWKVVGCGFKADSELIPTVLSLAHSHVWGGTFPKWVVTDLITGG